MNKKKLCALLMVVFSSVAQAETGSGEYIGIDGVRNATSFDGVNKEFNYTNFGGRIYVGKKINPALAIEAGLMMSPTHTKKTGDEDYHHEISIMTRAVDMGVVLTPIEQAPGFKVKAGLAIMDINIQGKEETPYSTHSNKASKITTGVVAGVAYEHPITDNVFANIGYSHYQQMTSDNLKEGETLDHANDVFSVGIKKQF